MHAGCNFVVYLSAQIRGEVGEIVTNIHLETTRRMRILCNNALPSGVHASNSEEEEERQDSKLSTEYILVCILC